MAGKSKYNREFKLAIIAQIEAGESVTQVARENVLSPSPVARWKREYKQNPEKAFSGPGHLYVDQARFAGS